MDLDLCECVNATRVRVQGCGCVNVGTFWHLKLLLWFLTLDYPQVSTKIPRSEDAETQRFVIFVQCKAQRLAIGYLQKFPLFCLLPQILTRAITVREIPSYHHQWKWEEISAFRKQVVCTFFQQTWKSGILSLHYELPKG